jgi:hypothetical protein
MDGLSHETLSKGMGGGKLTINIPTSEFFSFLDTSKYESILLVIRKDEEAKEGEVKSQLNITNIKT